MRRSQAGGWELSKASVADWQTKFNKRVFEYVQRRGQQNTHVNDDVFETKIDDYFCGGLGNPLDGDSEMQISGGDEWGTDDSTFSASEPPREEGDMTPPPHFEPAGPYAEGGDWDENEDYQPHNVRDDKFAKYINVLDMSPSVYVDEIAANPLSTPCGYREELPTIDTFISMYRFMFPIPTHKSGDDVVEEGWVSVIALLSTKFAGGVEKDIFLTSGVWPTDRPHRSLASNAVLLKMYTGRSNIEYSGTFDDFSRQHDYDENRFFPRVVGDILRRNLLGSIPYAELVDGAVLNKDGAASPSQSPHDLYPPRKRRCKAGDIFKLNALRFAIRQESNEFAGVIGMTARGVVSCITCNRRHASCSHLEHWLTRVRVLNDRGNTRRGIQNSYVDKSKDITSAYFPDQTRVPSLCGSDRNVKTIFSTRADDIKGESKVVLEPTCVQCGDNASYDPNTEMKRPGLLMQASVAWTTTVTTQRTCLTCGNVCLFHPQDASYTLVRDEPALRTRCLPDNHIDKIWNTHMIFVDTVWLMDIVRSIRKGKYTRTGIYLTLEESYEERGLHDFIPTETMFIGWIMKYIDVVVSTHAGKHESILLCTTCGTSNLSADCVTLGVLTRLMPPYMLNKYYNSSPSQAELILFKDKHVTFRGMSFANISFVTGEAGHSLLCIIRCKLIAHDHTPPSPHLSTVSTMTDSPPTPPSRAQSTSAPPVDVYEMHFKKLQEVLDKRRGDKRLTEDIMWNALRFVVDDFTSVADLHEQLTNEEKVLLRIISSKSPFPTGKGATLALALYVAGSGRQCDTAMIPSLDEVPTASHLGRHAAVDALLQKHKEMLEHTNGERGLYGSPLYPTSISKVSLDDLVAEFRLPSAKGKGTTARNDAVFDAVTTALDDAKKAKGTKKANTDNVASHLRDYLEKIKAIDGVFNSSEAVTVLSVLRRSFPPLADIILACSAPVMPTRWKAFCIAYADKITNLLTTELSMDHEHEFEEGNVKNSTFTSLAETLIGLNPWECDDNVKADPNLVLMVQALECDMLMPVSREELSHCGIRTGPHFANVRRRVKLYSADIAKNTLGYTATLRIPRITSDLSGRASSEYTAHASTCADDTFLEKDGRREGGRQWDAPTSSAMPGSLLVWSCACEMHKLQGCMLIDSGQGPRGYFDVLMRQKKPPDTIFYDNACLLQTYAMTREPHLFWGCRFIINDFDACNHTECSKLCRTVHWPDLKHYNTSFMKLHNARQCAGSDDMIFMNLPNFLNTMECCMVLSNEDVERRRDRRGCS